MSGVVHLPSRPQKQRMGSPAARLWFFLARKAGRPRAITPPLDGPLQIRSRLARGRPILELSGELDARTRGPLAIVLDRALDEDPDQIVLDLTGLVSIDRAGLETILIRHLRASDQLTALVIVPGPPPVQRAFDAIQGPFTFAPARGDRASRPTRRRGRRNAFLARPDGCSTGRQTGRGAR